MTRYSHRFAKRPMLGFIPTVEIVVPRASYGQHRFEYTVVRRVIGFTESHALSRALAWAHEHGDPR